MENMVERLRDIKDRMRRRDEWEWKQENIWRGYVSELMKDTNS